MRGEVWHALVSSFMRHRLEKILFSISWTREQGEMMAQALMFGLDVGIYGRLATRDHILELAALAESSGLESLWVADHVIFPVILTSAYPYSATGAFPIDMTQEPLLEPLATMGVLVGATQRVKIGTAV